MGRVGRPWGALGWGEGTAAAAAAGQRATPDITPSRLSHDHSMTIQPTSTPGLASLADEGLAGFRVMARSTE